MVNFRNVSIVFTTTILFNFSCSLNQNNHNITIQGPELKNVEPLQSANQNWNEVENESWKVEKITEPIKGIDGELTVENITQKRDMSQYADGGHTDCHGFRCSEQKILEFIRQHWTKRARGYIRVTYSGIDMTWTDHIFIEPNEKSEWRIIWRVVRWQALMPPDHWLDDAAEIVSVDRSKINSKNRKYKLTFKDKNSEVIRTLSF